MGKIHILDDHLANQIAAGEVVERPASVVKELVENAIDAGSRHIDVSVEEGGIKSIRVVDDGSGIEPDDMEAAFERHATSKIRHGKDLAAIKSLGFRGEALPSIAAVARVECISAAGDGGLGRRIVIEGGKRTALEDAAQRKGTDFRVEDLFYNTPARLKYLKTVQTELGHITDYMYRLALSRPDISFRLEHNGTVLLDTSGNGDLQQAAAAVYGVSTAKRMLPISAETPDYKLSGVIARPDITRSNRSGITAVINGRFVRNFQAAQAVLAGYHTLLPINRYPIAILHLEMDPSLVDVNVHPAKLEVRFSKEAELMESIQRAVREALRKETLIPSGLPVKDRRLLFGQTPQAQAQTQVQTQAEPQTQYRPQQNQQTLPPPPKPEFIQESLPLYSGRGASAAPAQPVNRPQQPLPAAQPRQWEPRDAEKILRALEPMPAAKEATDMPGEETVDTAEERGSESAPNEPRFPHLYPIGQLLGTYIVAQNEDGLFLIDQHAAHERINYEMFYRKFGSVEPNSQMTIFPHTIEFTSAEAQVLRSRLPLLESVGVYLEPFGGNTFKVRSIPEWFPSGEEAALIDEMAQWVLSEKAPDVAKIREASAIMCSCKASIKANQAQTIPALEKLLERLAECSNPFTCPHGRPIVVSFTKRDLEKMFKRVM